jgi:IS605 OrfB family transposase
LVRQIADRKLAIAAIARRLTAPVGETITDQHGQQITGYRSPREQYGKQQRLAHLRSELAELLAHRHPVIVRGGQRLWRARQHLAEANLTEPAWQAAWHEARAFRSALGSGDELSGNLTIRVDQDGVISILLPVALRSQANSADGRHYRLDATASFSYRGDEWRARLTAGGAITYTIRHDLERGRWYLDAAWKIASTPIQSIVGRTLGVDLNADHAACWVLDRSDNPIGSPVQIRFALTGSSSHRDAQLRAVISEILRLARQRGCTSVAIENLGWGDETGRENGQPKWFRRLISGFPTTIFRNRLGSMAARAGLALIAVDPAYTSQWAKPWVKPTSTKIHPTTAHEAAAIVIGRRCLGYPARRRGTTGAVRSDPRWRAARRAGLNGLPAVPLGASLPVRRSVVALPASGP